MKFVPKKESLPSFAASKGHFIEAIQGMAFWQAPLRRLRRGAEANEGRLSFLAKFILLRTLKFLRGLGQCGSRRCGSEKGVALMVVLGAVIVLTMVSVEFV